MFGYFNFTVQFLITSIIGYFNFIWLFQLYGSIFNNFNNSLTNFKFSFAVSNHSKGSLSLILEKAGNLLFQKGLGFIIMV